MSRENSVSYSGASSICSTMSNVSVNYDGDEMDLDTAVDHIFEELQHHINQMHVEIRNICQYEVRDDDYETTKAYFDALCGHIKDGSVLFKDLQKVIRQILPAKPKVPKTIQE